MKNSIFLGLTIGAFAVIAMMTSSVLPVVYADQGGDPNNSDQAQFNANGRFRDKLLDLTLDENHNNDNGNRHALDNMLDDRGVEP